MSISTTLFFQNICQCMSKQYKSLFKFHWYAKCMHSVQIFSTPTWCKRECSSQIAIGYFFCRKKYHFFIHSLIGWYCYYRKCAAVTTSVTVKVLWLLNHSIVTPFQVTAVPLKEQKNQTTACHTLYDLWYIHSKTFPEC